MTHQPAPTHPDNRTAAASPSASLSARGAIVGVASMLAFVALGREVGEPGVTDTDRHLLRSALGWTRGWPLAWVKAVTDLGTAPVIVGVVLATIALLVRRRRWPDVAFLIVAAVGAIVLSTVTKHLFARPRPVEFFRTYAPPNSFPSGHALNAAALALAVSFILWRSPLRHGTKIAGTVALMLYACCVGASRVVLGVHYPTDVLGGFLLAAAWVALLATVSRGMDLYRESQRSPDR